MNRRLFLCAVALAPTLLQPSVALAADLPPTLDGLVLVKSKRLEAVYLLPGADFRVYAKVMLDPPEVAFRKDWMRDYNEQAAFSDQITDNDAQSIMVAVRKGFDAILTKAFTDARLPGRDHPRQRCPAAQVGCAGPGGDRPVAGNVDEHHL